MMLRLRLTLALGLTSAALAACAAPIAVERPASASMVVRLDMPRRVLAAVADVAQVVISLDYYNGPRWSRAVSRAEFAAGVASVTFPGLPAGQSLVSAMAYDDDGKRIGSTSKNVSVPASGLVEASLPLTLDPTYTGTPAPALPIEIGLVGAGTAGTVGATVPATYTQAPPAAGDATGALWIAESTALRKVAPAGQTAATVPVTGVGAIAVDASGQVWTLQGRNVVIYTPGGAVAATAANVLPAAVGRASLDVAPDGTGWLLAGSTLYKLAGDGTGAASYPVVAGLMRADAAGVWVCRNSQTIDAGLYRYTTSGVLAGSYLDVSYAYAGGFTVDATGGAWVTKNVLPRVGVVRLDPTGTASALRDTTVFPIAVALDGAGGVWAVSSRAVHNMTYWSADGTTSATRTLPATPLGLVGAGPGVWAIGTTGLTYLTP